MSAQQDEHEHDDFDGEPTHELGPGEPPTPGWVPLVGLALFAVGGIYFLSTMDEEGDGSGDKKPAAAVSAEVKPAPPAPSATARRARPPARPRPAGARPAASGNPALGLTKERARELLERAQKVRQQREREGKPQ